MNNVFAIGALGGSGTRAVAEVLIKAGIYLGADLNNANDNLVFTRLFKQPDWFNKATEEDIFRRLRIFEKYMLQQKLTRNEIAEYFQATKSNSVFRTSPIHYLLFFIKNIITKTNERKAWGWKEPNSMIYIESIAKYFNSIKYIHVIRNGLDMAFSNNKQQLENWGQRFGIEYNKNSDNSTTLTIKQLDYWCRANTMAIDYSKKFLKGKFFLLNHTAFCKNPGTEVPLLLNFLNIKVEKELMEELIKIPKIPATIDRYKDKDLTIFPGELLEKVRKLESECENSHEIK